MQIQHICVAWAAPDLRYILEDIAGKTAAEVATRNAKIKDSLAQIKTWANAHFGYEIYNRDTKGCIVLPLNQMQNAPELQKEIESRIGSSVGLGFGYLPEHAELAAFQALKRPSPKMALYHPHMQPSHQAESASKDKPDPLAQLWQEEADYVDLPFAEGNEDYYKTSKYSAEVNPRYLGKSEFDGIAGIKGYQPMATAQDSETENLRQQIKEAQELGDPVERTHAGHDFLNVLRSRAGRKIFSQQAPTPAIVPPPQGLSPESRHKIKMALSAVAAHYQELEELKDSSPSTYHALRKLIDTITEIGEADSEDEDLQKSENSLEVALMAIHAMLKKLRMKKAEAPQPVKQFKGPVLPAGTIRGGGTGIHGTEGTVKIQHSNGKTDWVSARSGLTQSSQDRTAKPILGSSGHAISTASPER